MLRYLIYINSLLEAYQTISKISEFLHICPGMILCKLIIKHCLNVDRAKIAEPMVFT